MNKVIGVEIFWEEKNFFRIFGNAGVEEFFAKFS